MWNHIKHHFSPILGSIFRCFNHRSHGRMVARLQSFQTEAGDWGRGRSGHERPNKPGPKWPMDPMGQSNAIQPGRAIDQMKSMNRLWSLQKIRKSNFKISKKWLQWLQKNDKMESFTATPRYLDTQGVPACVPVQGARQQGRYSPQVEQTILACHILHVYIIDLSCISTFTALLSVSFTIFQYLSMKRNVSFDAEEGIASR